MAIKTLTASLGLALTASACSSTIEDIIGFRVLTAAPGVIQAGDTDVAWTIVGTGFEQGATISVDAPGVTVANVVVVDDREITFELTAPPTLVQGTADVTVTNPDMETRSTTVPTIPQTVTFGASVQPIFDAHCVSCHSGGAPAAGLNLSSGLSHAAIVDVPSTGVPTIDFVEPGDAGASYLVDKVAGLAPVGAQMPPNGPPLSQTQIALLVAWIEGGALND